MTRRAAVMMCLLSALAAAPAPGAETRRWVVDTTTDLLTGFGEGVEVGADGRLRWALGWSAGPAFAEPVVMAGARSADGSLLVATSHPARLYRVRGTELELLAEVPAEQVTAMLARERGGVVLATAAPSAIYEWSGGALTELGRPLAGAIWDLALHRGTVVAAGGSPATLYRLAERGLERWLELPDLHARCLASDGERLLVGTSGKGLVLSVDEQGRLGILVDSPFTEISDLAVGGGAVWAAALVGEPAAPRSEDSAAEEKAPEGEVQAEVRGGAELKLPKVNGATATSEILRVTPEGGLLRVHRFAKEVAAAIAWDGEGLLVGTGWEGEVWRFVADGGARLATIDAVQVVGILDGGAALLTQGPGGVVWRSADRAQPGRFRSAPQQYEQPVRPGEYRVEPPSPAVRIRFRAGVSAQPDDTWLPWSEWLPAAAGAVPLPPARALQWELELAPSTEAETAVERVEVAAVDVNLPPQIGELVVEEPGVVYLAAPPPSGPVLDALNPDVNGIFTVIDETQTGNGSPTKGKKYYRAGWRTVSWVAADPNDDPLRFTLELESRDGFRLTVRERLSATQLGVDTTAVPDGSYRFLLEASDVPGNPAGALTEQRASRWFTIDNSPPQLRLERRGETWIATASDALSPIARAEWSRDGREWQALAPADGLLDGREERFEIPASAGRHLVVVRAVDGQHNRAAVGAVEE